MQQPVVPPGTDPNADGDAIIAGELKKLQEYRSQMGLDNKSYVDRHPELRTIIDEFVTATISFKPDDILKFATTYFSDLKKNGKLGPKPFVIAGPSGVGKGTLIDKLLTKYPETFGFSVSHTTRNAREGEVNGVHYNFVSKSAFEEAVEKGDFIEYAKVHNNYYGTSIQAVEKIRTLGKICILDIDVQGVQSVKRSQLDCKYLFIEPPSLLELESRLKGRNTETAEKIKIRLQNAAGEMQYGKAEGNFDAIITNAEVEKSFSELVKQLQKWYPDVDLTF